MGKRKIKSAVGEYWTISAFNGQMYHLYAPPISWVCEGKSSKFLLLVRIIVQFPTMYAFNSKSCSTSPSTRSHADFLRWKCKWTDGRLGRIRQRMLLVVYSNFGFIQERGLRLPMPVNTLCVTA